MSNINRLISQSWLLLIFSLLFRLTTAQMYYEEDDTCDFGTYKGTCLRASNCPELPAIMTELGLKNTDVGHCGFTAMEEIICCPTKPTPPKKPKELPNAFIDLTKPYEFRPAPENETAPLSTPIAKGGAVDDWFSNNLKGNSENNNGRNSKSGNAIATNENGVFFQDKLSKSEEEKIRAIFGESAIAFGTGNGDSSGGINAVFNGNQGLSGAANEAKTPRHVEAEAESIQKMNATFNVNPAFNGNSNDREAEKINAIFSPVPAQNGIPIEENTSGKANLDEESIKRINAIFNVSPVLNGNPKIENNEKVKNGNPKNANNENINFIFSPTPAPKGIPIADNVSAGKENVDEESLKKINAIFNLTPTIGGNSEKESVEKVNSIFNSFSVPNGVSVEENTSGKENLDEESIKKINAIFNVRPSESGNPDNANNVNLNSIFNQAPAPYGIPIDENTSGVQRNLDEESTQVNANPIKNGNPSGKDIEKPNSVIAPIPLANGTPFRENTLGNKTTNEDAEQKINAIFNLNPAENGNPKQPESNAKIIFGPVSNGIAENSFEKEDDNKESIQKINSIFNINSPINGNPSNENTQKTNTLLNQDRVSEGIPIEENTLKKWNVNEENIGNPASAGNPKENKNYLFNQNPALQGIPIEENTTKERYTKGDNPRNRNPPPKDVVIERNTSATSIVSNGNARPKGNFNRNKNQRNNGDRRRVSNGNAFLNKNPIEENPLGTADTIYNRVSITNGNPNFQNIQRTYNGIPIEENPLGINGIRNRQQRPGIRFFGNSDPNGYFPRNSFPRTNILGSNRDYEYIQNGPNILTSGNIFNNNGFPQNTRGRSNPDNIQNDPNILTTSENRFDDNGFPQNPRAYRPKDPFQNFLKGPREYEQNRNGYGRNYEMPVQEPPIPLESREQDLPLPRRRYGRVYGIGK